MKEWLSYRLSDFVMFSARVYDRQIELHNERLAGLQILSIGFGIVLLWMCSRATSLTNRILPAVLGVGWVFVAWSFLWLRYAEINLLAEYAAPAFAAQGVALLALSLRGGGIAMQLPAGYFHYPALGFIAVAVLGFPLIAPAAGKPFATAEYFLMMPDPTALGTLAVLAFSATPLRWLLMIVPVLWCVLSGAMLWTLDMPTAPVLAVAAPILLVLAVLTVFRRR